MGRDVRYKERVLVGYRWFDAKKSSRRSQSSARPRQRRSRSLGLRIDLLANGGAVGTVSADVKLTPGRGRAPQVPQLYLGPLARRGALPAPAHQSGYRQSGPSDPGESKRVSSA